VDSPLKDANRAAELATTSESCTPMLALIDMDTMLMLHGEPSIDPVYAATTSAVA
jgi:hypothetical protein